MVGWDNVGCALRVPMHPMSKRKPVIAVMMTDSACLVRFWRKVLDRLGLFFIAF